MAAFGAASSFVFLITCRKLRKSTLAHGGLFVESLPESEADRPWGFGRSPPVDCIPACCPLGLPVDRFPKSELLSSPYVRGAGRAEGRML